MKTSITIAQGEDWTGIYADEELVAEGHQIALDKAMTIAVEYDVADITVRWVNSEWLADEGSLPANIEDVLWEGDTYPAEDARDDLDRLADLEDGGFDPDEL